MPYQGFAGTSAGFCAGDLVADSLAAGADFSGTGAAGTSGISEFFFAGTAGATGFSTLTDSLVTPSSKLLGASAFLVK